MKKVSDELKKQAIELRERGFSYGSIAEKVGLSQSTVRLACIEAFTDEKKMLQEIFPEDVEKPVEKCKSEITIPTQVAEEKEEIKMFGEVMSTGDYKIDRFVEISKENIELYIRKNKDYGDSFGQTYKEFGNTMAAIRLQDKLQRFKQLTKADAEVKDESIIDTLRDLSNYAIMTLIELGE